MSPPHSVPLSLSRKGRTKLHGMRRAAAARVPRATALPADDEGWLCGTAATAALTPGLLKASSARTLSCFVFLLGASSAHGGKPTDPFDPHCLDDASKPGAPVAMAHGAKANAAAGPLAPPPRSAARSGRCTVVGVWADFGEDESSGATVCCLVLFLRW